MNTTDQSLGDPGTQTPDAFTRPPTAPPIPDPAALAEAAVAAKAPMSVADVLAAARLPEKRARVCLAGDLVAEYDDVIAELAGLLDVNGEVTDDPEASIGEESKTARATRLNARADEIRVQMAEHMWLPLFRGMSSDDLSTFNAAHYPKEDGADLKPYHELLVAECSVEPKITVEEARQLRKTLPVTSWQELWKTAAEVCTGRIDIPKSLGFSVSPKAK
ncbi:hypothetical protein GON03_19020 [Nocardioides sp. MAH-18]|uniref:Uncharacterized protein n=1 Tax=Nocardioides agri TaxID=2682843 RepID=A0A6L6XW36_9ACTN|nr:MULTISPECIES: hypothetical protein [unclassified Nocardioides]MBA2952109.1 hypothetical protein [Nocardioides sp. CGMCC 1.13656]MVQ51278.1 hypothetical protein [Nocardioides sp. MAH-18]